MSVKNRITMKSKIGTIAVSERAERLIIEEVARLNARGIPANKKSVASSIIVNSLENVNGELVELGLANNLTNLQNRSIQYEN
ncbi:MAG: hypothetical protein LBC85_03615 [Fibromonadaceae bacterium]|nr:hypothetical protein [Fibromonadaceae bacterium]